MSKEEIITLIKSYVEILNSEGFSVRKAFLLGGYSTNINKI